MAVVIRIEKLAKQYRTGEIGTGTLSHDLQRSFARMRGKPDPFAKLGDLYHHSGKSTASSTLHDTGTLREPESDRYVWAIHDVSLEINSGEVLGIIGRNGAGKSTLLKILSRITAPTLGKIQIRGRIASLLEVGTGFHPELTGRENIFLNGAILGMGRNEIAQRFDEIVEFSGCSKYIDTPVKRYSSGMTVRLGFAVAAHLECDILIVDEVLAVGDVEFQQRCIGKMKSVSNSGRCVLFVSHNMGAVSQLCNRCALLENGSVAFIGNVNEAIRKYLDAGSVASVEFAENIESDFHFISVKITNSNRTPTNSFSFASPIVICLTYHLRCHIDGLEIGIRVISTNGPLVFSTLRSHSTSLPIRTGKNTIEIMVPGGFLNPGDYTIDVGSHIPNQRMLDLQENAIGFRIEETGSPFVQYAGTAVGLVYCKCEWRDT